MTTPQDTVGSEGMHIGHAAAGTEFLFRAHPAWGLTSAEAWYAFLERPDVRVVDDTGAEHPLQEFWLRATRRPTDAGDPARVSARWPGGAHRPREYQDRDGYPLAGYEFC